MNTDTDRLAVSEDEDDKPDLEEGDDGEFDDCEGEEGQYNVDDDDVDDDDDDDVDDEKEGAAAASSLPNGKRSSTTTTTAAAAAAAAAAATLPVPPPAPVRDPVAAAAAKEEGNKLFKANKFHDAIGEYTRAIELDDANAAYYGNRSAALVMIRDFKAALDDVQTALNIDPNNLKFKLRGAKCYVSLGRFTDAHRHYTEALTIDPNNAEAQQEIANLAAIENFTKCAERAFQEGNLNSALSFANRALDLALSSTAIKLFRVKVLLAQQNEGDADRAVSAILREDPTHADAHYWRGMIMYKRGELDKAVTHFQHALLYSPDHSMCGTQMKLTKKLVRAKEFGNDLFKQNKHEEAYAAYTEALSIDPGCKLFNSKLYLNRAIVGSKLKKLKEAVEDCTKAIELEEAYVKAVLKRAQLYLDLEMYEEAVRDFEKAKDMDPTNNDIREKLSNAQLELKKSKRKNYYKILEIQKDADEQEITKAYKTLAKKWHPDRHQGEEAKVTAEAYFKEIGEAHSVLSDRRKRMAYDSGQDLEDGCGHGGGGMSHADIFSQFYGGGGGFSFGGGGFGGGPRFRTHQQQQRGHGHGGFGGGFGGFGGRGFYDDEDDDE